MALDQYSICPCGNGKKIKFCKCHEHFSEIEKLDRMIQGDQSVAALDHINSLLKSLPSEPWLLAMKCELLLKLQEVESLEETSAKFIRLQPDNALAKMYRSLVAIMRGNPEEAASLLVQSIGESSGALHPLFMTVIVNLIEILVNSRQYMSALMLAELLLSIVGDEEQSNQYASEIYRSLISESSVSILQRELPPSPPVADDQPYAERYREALALLGGYQIQQCRTKLDGIQREFGPQAPPMIAKLHCQLLVADKEGATETCLRLAKADDLSEAQRVYFKALAFEFSPVKSGIAINVEVCSYDLNDEAAVESKLISNSKLLPIKFDAIREMFENLTEEEVPPKACFLVSEPAVVEEFPETKATESGSWIALIGRQTDKPPRLIMIEPTLGPQVNWTNAIRQELGLDAASRQVLNTFPVAPSTFYSSQIRVQKRVVNEKLNAFSLAVRHLEKQNFLNLPVPILNGGTPKSMAEQPAYRNDLMALLLHWQASGTTKLNAQDFAELHRELGLVQPALNAEEDTLDLVGGASYFWTDLENIEGQVLLQLAQSALSRQVPTVSQKYAQRIQAMVWSDDMAVPADYTALCLRTQAAEDPEEAEKLMFQMAEKGKFLGIPIGQAVLQRVDLLRSMGRKKEASDYLEKSYRDSPNDPVLQQWMQMMMMQMQQAKSGGMVRESDMNSRLYERGISDATASSGSGLWTPDQASPSEPARQSAAGGGSGSGLWIPD